MADEKKNPTEDEIEETEEEEETQETGGDSGEEKPDKSNKNNDSGKKKVGNTGKGDSKVFTQEQVTKISTREKNQGRASALKEMGIDPKDTKMIAMIKAFVDSQKTDDQRAAEQQAEAQKQNAENERRLAIAEAKAEAMMQGVKTQYVDDIVTLALAKVSDDSDLKTIIGEFKTKYPVWFGESDEDENDKDKGKGKTGQRGTGSSMKSNDKEKKGDEKSKGIGARLAAQRKSGNSKSSYWGAKK